MYWQAGAGSIDIINTETPPNLQPKTLNPKPTEALTHFGRGRDFGQRGATSLLFAALDLVRGARCALLCEDNAGLRV